MSRVLYLDGPLDLAHADDQRPLLLAAACAEQPELVLDLSGVPDVDPTGLGMLVGARQRVRQRGGCFRVVNVRPEVIRQMTVARVWPLLAEPVHNAHRAPYEKWDARRHARSMS